MSEIVPTGYSVSKRKRLLDLFGSLVGLVFLSLIFLFIVIIMKVYSRGPVFYKRARLGLHGKGFDLLKFRTMNEGSDQKKSGLRTQVFDNRITNIGRTLRKSYIDELPQFWNVFKGDMSIVGPRPEFPELYVDLEKIMSGFTERLVVRPGITGLAQTQYKHAHNDIEAAGRLEYDMKYIETASFFGDLSIIVQTVFRSMKFKGS